MHSFRQNKQLVVVFTAIILSALLIGCGPQKSTSSWGNRLKYDGSTLFYTSSIPEAKARELGDYLMDLGFFQKDNPGTVQITKDGDTYQFRMVVKEDAGLDKEFLTAVALFSAHISQDIFGGQSLETHLCDDRFKTLEVVTFKIEEEETVE
jgi:hypothetical protein